MGAPAPPLGEILLLFMWPLRSPPGPGMTPAGCSGIGLSGGPGIEPIEPFESGLLPPPNTVRGEELGPRPSSPLLSFKQSGVTGVKGVSEEEEEEEEFDDRPFFSDTS